MLLTVNEVAERLKTNKNYVYALINSGLLVSIKLGCKKVREETLAEFLKKYDGEDIDKILKAKEMQLEMQKENY